AMAGAAQPSEAGLRLGGSPQPAGEENLLVGRLRPVGCLLDAAARIAALGRPRWVSPPLVAAPPAAALAEESGRRADAVASARAAGGLGPAEAESLPAEAEGRLPVTLARSAVSSRLRPAAHQSRAPWVRPGCASPVREARARFWAQVPDRAARRQVREAAAVHRVAARVFREAALGASPRAHGGLVSRRPRALAAAQPLGEPPSLQPLRRQLRREHPWPPPRPHPHPERTATRCQRYFFRQPQRDWFSTHPSERRSCPSLSTLVQHRARARHRGQPGAP